MPTNVSYRTNHNKSCTPKNCLTIKGKISHTVLTDVI